MNPVILYRNDADWQNESEVASKHFETIGSRTLIKPDSLVIARFSALPFYKELEDDLAYSGSKLINSYEEHRYIADLENWYYDLKDFTPETWFKLEHIPEKGPFVLKGETNSKKFLWNTHMYAEDKKAAIAIESKLFQDSLLTYQKVCIRKYHPLVRWATSFNELPVTKEYRFFCYKQTVLSGGYYWSSHTEDLADINIFPDVSEVPQSFLDKVMWIVSQNTTFYVIDVAKTEAGEWIVIELNDGQMSGLSDNNPNVMYSNLKKIIG